MKKILILLSSLVLILTFSLLLALKTIPTGQLWKGYSIMYVPADANEMIVQNSILQSGITQYASYSSQYMPVNFSVSSPEISISSVTGTGSDNYLQRRNNYFFDFSRTYKVYYIESSQSVYLKDCVKLLSQNGIRCGVDSKASYPFVLPVFFLIVFALLIFYSRNKVIFSLSGIFPFLFILTNPFYTAFTTSALFLLFLFIILNLWRRKGAVELLLRKYTLFILIFVSVTAAFSCSLTSGFIFILVMISSGAVCYLYYEGQLFYESKQIFVPVYIHSAKKISPFAGRAGLILPVIGITFAITIFLAVLLSSDNSVSSKNAKILLPSANSNYNVGKENLPMLDEYSRWFWNLRITPYKTLNKKYTGEETSISYPRYIYDGEKINKINETINYDNHFIADSISQIDSFQFYSIEKVLKSQNESFNPGYASSQSYRNSFFSILMMLICFFVLLFIYISIIIKKRF